MASSPEVRQRFEREAKTISQLSHPHICALYDVGREGDTEYLVMELLEGESLSDRLARGALPLEQTLRYGVEIADALDKAHRQGIVHRDLKPGNVMITKSGVKLLDFGLAKAMAPSAKPSSFTALPTQQALTQEGTILGTFQYMAPEQLEGKEADGRTDVFAFGAVLYEMATGKKAFSAASQASLITAIMSADPPAISTVQPMSPPALDRVVKKCLAKDPEDRWQNAADLASELKWIAESGSQAGVAAPTILARRRRGRLAWALVGLFAVTSGFLAFRLLGRDSVAGASVHAALLVPERDGSEAMLPELSPDGRSVVFGGLSLSDTAPMLLRNLGSDEARPIPGTEGGTYPFWSPDGKSLGFFVARKLKRIDVAGGSAATICDATEAARGGTWSREGIIVFSAGRNTGLTRVAASGGTPESLTKPDAARGDTSHRWPVFLPDGRHLLYYATPNAGPKGALFYASVDGKENRLLVEDATNGAFSRGYLLFSRKRKLLAQPFDPTSGRLSGNPVPVVEGVGAGFGVSRAMFSASLDGTLVYLPNPSLQASTLEWLDRGGKRLGSAGESLLWFDPVLSPDGKRLAVGLADSQLEQGDIWVLDLVRGTRTRLTFGPGSAWSPVWSPDSERVAYIRESDDGKPPGIYAKAASGAGGEEQILAPGALGELGDLVVTSWSPDGKTLVTTIFKTREGTNYGIWTVPLAAGSKPQALIDTTADEYAGSLSPDGRWIAYAFRASGRGEIYVQAFPGPGAKFQISTEGGEAPVWRADGKELLFLSPDGHVMAAPIQTSPSFEAGTPRALFAESLKLERLAVSPDGQRLLVRIPRAAPAASSVRLVLNWPAGLK
jgi:Tol biopolymer transport system component